MCRRTTCAVLVLVGMSAGVCAQDGPPRPPGRADEAGLPALTGANVTIPWAELKALVEAGRPARAAVPVDYLFSPATLTATVSDDRAAVECDFEVEVLRDDRALVPLGDGRHVQKVLVDGQPGALALRQGRLWVLLGKGKGKVRLVMGLAVSSDGPARSVAVALPPSPIVTVVLTVPATNLDVPRPAEASSLQTAEKGGSTVITAGFGGGSTARILWQPARPKLEPRLYAYTNTRVTVADALIGFTAAVHLRVARAAPRQLRFLLDPAVTVLSARGAGVARWYVDAPAEAGKDPKAAGPRVLVVEAREELCEGEHTIRIEYDRDLPGAGGEVTIRLPSLQGARTDSGQVGIESGGALEIQAVRTPMTRVSVNQLPTTMPAGRLDADAMQFVYRYARPPAEAVLALARPEKLPAKVHAQTATLATVDAQAVRCRAAVSYEVRNAGVDAFRIVLPDDVEVVSVVGEGIRRTGEAKEAGKRVLLVELKNFVQGAYSLDVAYDRRLRQGAKSAGVPLLGHPEAVQDRGVIGIEAVGGVEVTPTAAGAEQMDVRELPSSVWRQARRPVLLAYRYGAAGAAVTLGIVKHEDVEVLVAVSDVCEAATTFTPDGKVVTKMMYVVRNNLKQFLVLKMPAGADLWSAFVDDQPVTPSRNAKGEVLIPLKKSAEADEDDEDSYRARREKRRAGPDSSLREQRSRRMRKAREDGPVGDLKPYDVEIVFVGAKVELGEKGDLAAALPQCDIPVGHLAWAVFLPRSLRLVDAVGNMKEVGQFSLAFRHFADEQYARLQARAAKQAQAMEKLQAQLRKIDEQAALAAPKAAGVLPVRVEIPIAGEIHRFEKLLVTEEAPQMTLTFRRALD